MMIGLIGNAVRIVKYDLQQKMCRVDMAKGASRRNAAPNEMVLTDGFLRYIIVITKIPNTTVDHGSSHGIRNTGAIPPTKPIARCAAWTWRKVPADEMPLRTKWC